MPAELGKLKTTNGNFTVEFVRNQEKKQVFPRARGNRSPSPLQRAANRSQELQCAAASQCRLVLSLNIDRFAHFQDSMLRTLGKYTNSHKDIKLILNIDQSEYQQFRKQMEEKAILVACGDSQIVLGLACQSFHQGHLTYLEHEASASSPKLDNHVARAAGLA